MSIILHAWVFRLKIFTTKSAQIANKTKYVTKWHPMSETEQKETYVCNPPLNDTSLFLFLINLWSPNATSTQLEVKPLL